MKLIIAGSRGLEPTVALVDALAEHFELRGIKEVVSGVDRGVDECGELWAAGHWGIPVRRFPAAWDEHGRQAGPIRNAEMAAYAGALLLIWDGESRGSASMRREMLRRGKPVYEVVLKSSQIAATASEPAGKG